MKGWKWYQERYQERKKTGTCVWCGKVPAVPGTALCEQCKAHGNDKDRKLRAKREKAGVCKTCGVGEPAAGKRSCAACLKKNAKRMQRRRAKNRKIGKCLKCGKPAKENRVQCDSCLKKQREQMQALRDKSDDTNLCRYCLKEPRAEGITVCKKCSQRESRRVKITKQLKQEIAERLGEETAERIIRQRLCTECGKRRENGVYGERCRQCKREYSKLVRLMGGEREYRLYKVQYEVEQESRRRDKERARKLGIEDIDPWSQDV